MLIKINFLIHLYNISVFMHKVCMGGGGRPKCRSLEQIFTASLYNAANMVTPFKPKQRRK